VFACGLRHLFADANVICLLTQTSCIVICSLRSRKKNDVERSETPDANEVSTWQRAKRIHDGAAKWRAA